MKKSGFFILENMVSLILILIISGALFLNVNPLKNIYNEYSHNRFKMQILNFINYGKYKAANEGLNYSINFYKDYISLDQSSSVKAKLKFPEGITMVDFNGINNRKLMIKTDGSITRGATFTYRFKKKLYEITIDTITGRVSYV